MYNDGKMAKARSVASQPGEFSALSGAALWRRGGSALSTSHTRHERRALCRSRRWEREAIVETTPAAVGPLARPVAVPPPPPPPPCCQCRTWPRCRRGDLPSAFRCVRLLLLPFPHTSLTTLRLRYRRPNTPARDRVLFPVSARPSLRVGLSWVWRESRSVLRKRGLGTTLLPGETKPGAARPPGTASAERSFPRVTFRVWFDMA